MRASTLLLALLPPGAALSAQAPEQGAAFSFEATTLGGKRITHQDFAEGVLLVDFWGTWCEDCKQTVPALERLYRKYKHFGLEIVGFNYEPSDVRQPLEATRAFAVEHEVTYALALGTPAIRQQAGELRGYPTLLLLDKGLVPRRTLSGFRADQAPELEREIRSALGLPVEELPAAEEAAPPVAAGPEPLPPGVIFKPGDGDTGFDFDLLDADGERLAFGDLRDKVVVLALTSTWDGEAVATAKMLNALHDAHAAAGTVVLAACLDSDKKPRATVIRAIRTFRDEHDLRYRLFPAGQTFQGKVHMFGGMPTLLVFDKQGRLVLRERGASQKTAEAVEAAIEQHR